MTITQARLYQLLLITYPIFVLFSPKLNIGITHAKVDELLLALWLPNAFLEFVSFYLRAGNYGFRRYIVGLMLLFGVFLLGLALGDADERFSISNIKLIIRPLIIIANIIVLRYWIIRSKLSVVSPLCYMLISICVSAIVALYSMKDQSFAQILIDQYSEGIYNYNYSDYFDMSWRAMGVFAGYDAAAITYGMGIVVASYLLISRARSTIKTVLLFLAIMIMTFAIVASARIGIVATVPACFVLFLIGWNISWQRKITFAFISLIISMILIPLATNFFPHVSTIERFLDGVQVLNLFSSESVFERAEGVSTVLNSQYFDIILPQGVDMFFGFGDHGYPISDIGYVTVFVKYGFVGLAALGACLYSFIAPTIQSERYVYYNDFSKEKESSCNYILISLITLIAIGMAKGGLYFLAQKTGELFAIVVACSVIESERYTKTL